MFVELRLQLKWTKPDVDAIINFMCTENGFEWVYKRFSHDVLVGVLGGMLILCKHKPRPHAPLFVAPQRTTDPQRM